MLLQHQNGYFGVSHVDIGTGHISVDSGAMFGPVLILLACLIETSLTPVGITAIYGVNLLGLVTWHVVLTHVDLRVQGQLISSSGDSTSLLWGNAPHGITLGAVALIMQWLVTLCVRVHEEETQRERYVRVIASFDAQADVNLVLENLYPDQVIETLQEGLPVPVTLHDNVSALFMYRA
jgi:hypothetical protein